MQPRENRIHENANDHCLSTTDAIGENSEQQSADGSSDQKRGHRELHIAIDLHVSRGCRRAPNRVGLVDQKQLTFINIKNPADRRNSQNHPLILGNTLVPTQVFIFHGMSVVHYERLDC
jgi:hypothetical protein